MKIEEAREVYEGKSPAPADATLGEMIQLLMGACLEDDGNIFCLRCNLPNECCHCGEEEKYE
jgi:hypothetical protein